MNNEMLRVLLAEARERIHHKNGDRPLCQYSDRNQCEVCALAKRIDAALAEPMDVVAAATLAASLKAHGQGHAEGWEAGYAAGQKDAGREHDDEVRRAYLRGAIRMREEVGQWLLQRRAGGPILCLILDPLMTNLALEVTNLTIPEDKP